MQVVALAPGFYAGTRRRTGDIFELDSSKLKQKDGKPVMPSWVKPAPDVAQAKAEAAKAKKAENDKQVAGSIAASGGKAAKAKVDAVAKQLAG
jgi:hypothetical protein